MKARWMIVILLAIELLQAAGQTRKKPVVRFDKDRDGVIDRFDRCPHTPFFALVNHNGCMVKRLEVSEATRKLFLSIVRKGHR